jgi:hypothetical protein
MFCFCDAVVVVDIVASIVLRDVATVNWIYLEVSS